ncbi:MAG: sodium:calcium antiporter [Acidimicrobiia bacterium]|nr:sodium:calcium antiporter [Acidimicrobiia bacterium]
MIFAWLAAVVVGFPVAVLASQRVVRHAKVMAAQSRIPKFVVGVSLLAVGTDLPEIANSIIASLADQGDINVGDSLGSTATQVTLVLGLMPFLGGAMMVKRGGGTVKTAWLTVAALALGAALMSDGFIARTDALILISAWLLGSIYLWRRVPQVRQLEFELDGLPRSYHVVGTLVALLFVAGGAALAVAGIIGLAETLGIPGFLISFFGASIGTSLPELIVDVSALKSGEPELAVGDAVGSSFVDATLSIGSGPLIAPTAITAGFAIQGALLAMVAVAIVALLFSRVRRHDRRTGALLIIVYAAFYLVLL